MPVATDVLLAALVGIVDAAGGLVLRDGLAVGDARDERSTRGVAEDVQRVVALSQVGLGATSDQYHRPSCDRVVDDMLGDLEQSLLRRREWGRQSRRHDLG